MSEQTYDDICYHYASEQGLTPIMEALDEAGADWSLLQSSGYRMIVTVRQENVIGGYLGDWGITHAGGDEWIVCWYEGGIDSDVDEDPVGGLVIGTAKVVERVTQVVPEADYQSHGFGQGVKW